MDASPVNFIWQSENWGVNIKVDTELGVEKKNTVILPCNKLKR